MQNEKLRIAYERLSRDDEAVGDSLSIQNQKMLLEDYATRHGVTGLTHLVDDGWSGTRIILYPKERTRQVTRTL